jgi:hypothetical protein
MSANQGEKLQKEFLAGLYSFRLTVKSYNSVLRKKLLRAPSTAGLRFFYHQSAQQGSAGTLPQENVMFK